MNLRSDGMVMAESLSAMSIKAGGEMGLGAGGKMKQKIYPDPHGIDTWDENNKTRVYVHIVNSIMYREITGKEPPPTPISVKEYQRYGLPWFDLYDEHLNDIAAPEVLKNVKSVKEIDAEKGFKPQQDDDTVNVPDSQIKKLPLPADDGSVRDGEW